VWAAVWQDQLHAVPSCHTTVEIHHTPGTPPPFVTMVGEGEPLHPPRWTGLGQRLHVQGP
jgi:hypothetical protein